jgi:hypothetical protein
MDLEANNLDMDMEANNLDMDMEGSNNPDMDMEGSNNNLQVSNNPDMDMEGNNNLQVSNNNLDMEGSNNNLQGSNNNLLDMEVSNNLDMNMEVSNSNHLGSTSQRSQWKRSSIKARRLDCIWTERCPALVVKEFKSEVACDRDIRHALEDTEGGVLHRHQKN